MKSIFKFAEEIYSNYQTNKQKIHSVKMQISKSKENSSIKYAQIQSRINQTKTSFNRYK